ncbi:hypothetical protein [Streptomyces sp. NPDC060035]|uniref:hypothetical protein n=1 Tax=Streptomyces sp. NPDC060035 TaxID=3347044 RepID=UPI0036924DC7
MRKNAEPTSAVTSGGTRQQVPQQLSSLSLHVNTTEQLFVDAGQLSSGFTQGVEITSGVAGEES